MRPLEDLFHLLPGQVAELAESVGKKVRIDFAGGNIRLDGRIVEQLSEPLMHLIRNAVDHGLETPDQRQQAGKHAEGWIWIGALENAGWVRITVADDGCGIDLRQIWQRAAELNLTDILEPPPSLIKQGYQFLFDDRFSSRRKATSLSGRGVGLAAVKRRVQELQGDISVESEPGLVTRFILTIPESLSSRRQVIVALKRGAPDSGLLAIPLGMVQLVRRSNHTKPGNEDNDNASQVMPVVSLAELFDGVEADPMKSDADYELILSDGIRSVRAIVTDIVAEAEMVVEPLPGLIQPIPLIAGITVWSDDRILPVLNVPTLLNQVYISLIKEQTALKHEG
jgi:two-component system chemotaxis sensor kinase CheA